MKTFEFKPNAFIKTEYALKLYVQELPIDKDYIIEVKEKRKKRSLDANAYFWVLVDKLAKELRSSKLSIYKNAVRDIGGVSETVCVQERAVSKLCEGWEHNGLGWQTEIFDSKIKGCKNVILYYGSSTYDTQQMSLLIDNIVQDCQAVGIETMTPCEIELLKVQWGGGSSER